MIPKSLPSPTSLDYSRKLPLSTGKIVAGSIKSLQQRRLWNFREVILVCLLPWSSPPLARFQLFQPFDQQGQPNQHLPNRLFDGEFLSSPTFDDIGQLIRFL